MGNDEKRENMHQILDLVMDINGFEERKQDVTGNKPTVFMYIFGHTACIEVDVVPNGWVKTENTEHYRQSIYFDGSNSVTSKSYDKFIENLERIKIETCK